MKLSVVVPVKNEEGDLPRLLDSLDFADEVIIIDTGSSDKSVEIAKKHGAKVVSRTFENFAQIRNYGSGVASNDWILAIDADNEVPLELAREIDSLPDVPAAYKIGRINIIWDKPILHADWGPRDDCHIRLYHKAVGEWHSTVHEQFKTKAPIKTLKQNLIHHNYSTISEFVDKLNNYSNLGDPVPWWYPFYDFAKRYFYKLGFMEGLHGLFLSYLQGIYYLTVIIKRRT